MEAFNYQSPQLRKSPDGRSVSQTQSELLDVVELIMAPSPPQPRSIRSRRCEEDEFMRGREEGERKKERKKERL